MGEENFQIIGADGTRLRPPSLALPPSDEGGGKPEGFDGGRDTAGLRKERCPEDTGCEFSPSVACGDSSLPDRGRFCGNAIAAPRRGPRAI